MDLQTGPGKMPSEPALRVVLRPLGCAPYTLTLDRLTAHVRASRMLRMGRLAAALERATNAITDVETATERDVDRLVERTKELHAKRENVMLRKQMQLDAQMTDLAEFERDLETFDGKNDHSGVGENSGSAYTGTTGTTAPQT